MSPNQLLMDEYQTLKEDTRKKDLMLKEYEMGEAVYTQIVADMNEQKIKQQTVYEAQMTYQEAKNASLEQQLKTS
jgi:hypothetical protein